MASTFQPWLGFRIESHTIGTMLRRLLAIAGLIASLACATAPPETKPLNVVFILVDDMGYADVEPFGNTYHLTPNISKLSNEGMRFTAGYAAAPNCSPTRGSILTGKWPARTGVTQYLPGNHLPWAKLIQVELPDGMPLEEIMLAQPLKAAGYATASMGKWHLGGGEYLPERRGFDLNFGGGAWGHHKTMFAPFGNPDVPGDPPGQYLTDRLAAEAENFIAANRDKPFFLYLPLYAVHSPIEAKPDLIAHYDGLADPTGRNNKTYAAMVEGVDQLVGRVLQKLEETGAAGNTAVFFFSDNGGVEGRAFNGGFRRGKGWVYEAGIREPLLVKWPGVAAPGSVCETPVSSVDFYPTILEMTGVNDLAGHASDGASLAPLLKQSGALDRDTLYWHYPHYSNAGSPPAGAIREGDWKLIEFFEDSHTELYSLADDPSESQDRAAEMPEKTEALLAKLVSWRESVNAKMPLPNPDFDRARAAIKKPVEE
jgi:arylsulfatase A-like enzyme